MSSATLQLLDTLDGFKDLHAVGENPSPNEIAAMFALLDEARAEVSALTGERELRVEQDADTAPDFATDDRFDYGTDPLVPGPPRSAAPSRPAEGAARVGQRPSLDEVDASLQQAVSSRPKGQPLVRRKPARRKGASR